MKCAIFKRTDGGASIGMICDPTGKIIAPDINKHLDEVVANNPDFVSWRITDHTNLPGGSGNDSYDNTFKNAFTDELPGEQLDVDLPKAKEIAHNLRRAKRAEDFKPHDEAIAMQIPGTDVSTEEASRQAIRDADSTLQDDLEKSSTPGSLKKKMVSAGLV